MMRRAALFACLALPLACARAPAPSPAGAASPPAGAAAWALLTRTLPGRWTLPSKTGSPFVVSYKLVANGSALVEDWGEGTPHETETVFYPDQDGLLLTHFCAQGNQPRLRAAAATADSVVFRFVDVTNKEPDQAMLVERTLRFGAGGAFDDTETYRAADGTNDTTTYHFARSDAASDGHSIQ